MAKIRKPVKQRFEDKYIAEPNSGCWVWIGADSGKNNKQNNIYGRFYFGEGNYMNAHRASWIIYRDRIPENLCVLHTCDNPLCVNPDHLFLGTHEDNMTDMKEKGRAIGHKGSDHPCSKISAEQVQELLELRSKGLSIKALEETFNIKKSLIWNIIKGNHWSLKSDDNLKYQGIVVDFTEPSEDKVCLAKYRK